MTSHYKEDERKKLKEKWIEFNTETNCTVIKPIALDVTWGKDNRYWTIPTKPEEALVLKQVAWLEVKCNMPINEDLGLKPGVKYKVNFKVSMTPNTAFGWSGCPVYLMVQVDSNKPSWKSVDLSQLATNEGNIPADTKPLTFTTPEDGTHQLSLGMYEIWRGRWKGGLAINEVTIMPYNQQNGHAKSTTQ